MLGLFEVCEIKACCSLRFCSFSSSTTAAALTRNHRSKLVGFSESELQLLNIVPNEISKSDTIKTNNENCHLVLLMTREKVAKRKKGKKKGGTTC